MKWNPHTPPSLYLANTSGRLPVPRVTGRSGAPAALLGLGLLLLLAASGAALVHIIEYHLGLGSSGDWRASARAMLARYPLSGSLLVVILFTLGTVLAVLRELRVLSRERRHLIQAAAAAGMRPIGAGVALPRRPSRLLQLLAPQLLVQLGVSMLASHLWPMDVQMRMDGVLMTMQARGAVPLLPTQLVVATLLAILVWRLERRLTVLRSVIATVRRLLRLVMTGDFVVRIPPGPAPRPLCAWVAPALLSRPPPV